MTQARLTDLSAVKDGVIKPGYTPADHGNGIVHLGLGAFHRAHQAVYTDDALAASGGDWRIIGVSLRSTTSADQLNPQNGLYTVLERSSAGTKPRVLGSISGVLAGPAALPQVIEALTAESTKIVSLTVTEKAYGIRRDTGEADTSHPAVAHDLENPDAPTGVLGLIVKALRIRRDAGLPTFTVLCCDNLAENGAHLRSGTLDFAKRIDPNLAEWIAANVTFPSTMVDRITPASTAQTLEDAQAATGFSDLAAIETEPFSQWVIEDDFTNGRPDWDKGGALFVQDVVPYEMMKLRMLNGAHSMLAYAGNLCGCTYVRDVMDNADLAKLVDRHMRAAAATLPALEVDIDAYRADLISRFENKSIAHETAQIAQDGTEKLPPRIFAPALDAIAKGQNIDPFAFAAAAWMTFATEKQDTLQDPRADDIRAALANETTAEGISNALHALSGFVPSDLQNHAPWRAAVAAHLQAMMQHSLPIVVASTARAL